MKVFISYRRNDERHAAARVYERLVHDLGKDNVFLDVDSLRYGADFVNVIGNTIAACEWCLVVISKNWRGPSATGTARIDDEADFVRIEIETALRSPKTTVIPVLVGDTAMPQPSDISKSMHALLKCHAFRLRADPHFQTDLNELIAHLAVVPAIAPDEMSMFDLFTTRIDWGAIDEERRATLNLVFALLLSCVEGRELSTEKLASIASLISRGQLSFQVPQK